MPNLFWYSCLAVIGVGTAAFSIYTKRHTFRPSTLIAFYLFATSITWLGEFVALGIFNGYAYKPGLFPDIWEENLTGHLILNSTLWPGAATLIVAYSLGYGWISAVTAFFVFAEYLFVRLGIYCQYWWKYYMSAIIVVAFLLISRSWFVEMDRSRRGLVRAVTFFFIGLVIIHLPMPFLLLAGKQYYRMEFIAGLVGNPYRTSIMFIFTYHMIECILLVFFVCMQKKRYFKLVPYITAFAGQTLLAKMNILRFQGGWNLLYTILAYALTLTVFILVEKYMWRPEA